MKMKNHRALLSVLLAAVLAFPGYVPAAEKTVGNTLVLQMKSGPTVQGELLAVKGDRLILFDMNSLTGLEIGIGDVSKIRIVKPSKFGSGVGLGILIGGASGALLGLVSGNDTSGFLRFSAGQKAAMGALGLGILGIPVGGIAGALSGIDESIDIAGLPAASQAIILGKLKAYARTAGEFSKTLEVRPAPVVREEARPAEPAAPRKRGRFHLSVIPGYFRSPSAGQIGDLMRGIGFNSAVTYSGGWFGSGSSTTAYPLTTKDTMLFIKDVRLEYSLSRAFALGVSYSPLGRHTVTGRHVILGKDYRYYYPPETYLVGSGEGKTIFLTASLFPVPDAFLKKLTFKLSAGIGYADVRLDYTGSQFAYAYEDPAWPADRKSASRKGLGGLLAAELIYFFNPHWSLGLNGDFKYVPVVIGGFAIDCPYLCYEVASAVRLESLRIDIPAKTSNFGGWGIGLNFGYHF